MKKWLSLTFAFACGAISTPGMAVDIEAASADVPAVYKAGMEQWRLSRSTTAKVAGNNERPGTPQVNKLRAYPPSCGAGALPDKPSGTPYTKEVKVLAADSTHYLVETVNVIVWRIPCSSSGSATPYNPTGAPNAMTLVRIERSAELANQYLALPLISASQGTIAFDTPASYPRLVTEANTLNSEVMPGKGLNTSTTFVLDNSPLPNSGYFRFNEAFKLRIDPRPQLGQNGQVVDFDIPAYTPGAGADAPMPLDGYAAAQWTNAELGHGLLVQIAEQYGTDGTMTRQLVYDLLLKDLDGNPFWLIGNAPFPLSATSITLDAGYLGANLGLQPWGKATFQLKHCNRLEVTYTPNADLAAPVPSFDGVIVYDRLFSANGMLCE